MAMALFSTPLPLPLPFPLPLHHHQLFLSPLPLCKCSSSFPLSFYSLPSFTPLLVRAQVSTSTSSSSNSTRIVSTSQELSKNTTNGRAYRKSTHGLSQVRGENKKAVENYGENGVGLVERRNNEKVFRKRRELGYGCAESRDGNKRVGEEIGGNGVGLVEKRSNDKVFRKKRELGSDFSETGDENKRVEEKIGENGAILVGKGDNERSPRKKRDMCSRLSPTRLKNEDVAKKSNIEIGKRSKKGVDKEKIEKGDKKSKIESPALKLRIGLDMCSKKGDVMGALDLYDKAQREGIILGQYHYTVLLYLCSSAAIGVVSPAKSGSSSRSLSTVDSIGEVSMLNSKESDEIAVVCNDDFYDKSNNQLSGNRKGKILDGVGEPNGQVKNRTIHLERDNDCDMKGMVGDKKPQNFEIRVSEDFRKYAFKRGFEIYEKMCLEKVIMNEASLTSIARMSLAMGDGNRAFDTVKHMKELGINPRLRSYGPALSAFCNGGKIDEAFLVEEHMLENGVYPEEPELEALLKVSIEGSRSDKVYYLLHKLRTNVRQVLPFTAALLEKYFKSDTASKVGKSEWDERAIREAIEKGGGGWHGKGWLGEGKWNVSRTYVGNNGICKCCGEKLATIDIDPVETEKFAESVASIAAKREKKMSFQKFQKWLDYYGPFEAIIDAANIGLYTQRKFKPSKVNAVVNGIRHLLPSKKWPLIVLHNRRVTDDNMDKPMNKAIVEKWKNADALYATPTGSNDDWYWLYAAIKFKCLLVTNDEMRDHLFQLLGNDFFPKWKERHQVRFSFSETGPIFHMPPPCSVVIQESEKGHWHIPLASEHEYNEEERMWLCVTRDKTPLERLRSATICGDSGMRNNGIVKTYLQENSPNISSTSSACSKILRNIEAAERHGGCIVDFEI